jgi:hypothetical protein
MYEAEFELEAELEDLMTVLAKSDLMSEAESFAPLDLLREQAIIADLLARGVRNENQIADAVFFNRHPERNGRRLAPGESALVQEWVQIRDQVVRPILGYGMTQPAVPSLPAGRKGYGWVSQLVPLLDRYRGQIPARANRYAGEIPLYLLLGWINVESAGRLERPTSIGELGYFQLHPDESKDLGLPSHSRLRTDPEYSIWAGTELVRWKAWGAHQRGFPQGTELFWRVAKWLHWLPGVVDLFLKDMRAAGVDPNTGWSVIEQYVGTNQNRLDALTRATYRKKSLGNWQAMVGINNVNKTIQSGQQLAAGLGSP